MRAPDKKAVYARLSYPVFYFIGNFDFLRHRKKRMFAEHTLDKPVF